MHMHVKTQLVASPTLYVIAKFVPGTNMPTKYLMAYTEDAYTCGTYEVTVTNHTTRNTLQIFYPCY